MKIGLKPSGLDGYFPDYRRAITGACLHSLGKRCVLAHALIMLSSHCIVTGPKLLIASFRISLSKAAFPFHKCFKDLGLF